MKPLSEYYSDDGYKKASIFIKDSLYKVVAFNSYFEKKSELNFEKLQDAEDYAEDYIMGIRK